MIKRAHGHGAWSEGRCRRRHCSSVLQAVYYVRTLCVGGDLLLAHTGGDAAVVGVKRPRRTRLRARRCCEEHQRSSSNIWLRGCQADQAHTGALVWIWQHLRNKTNNDLYGSKIQQSVQTLCVGLRLKGTLKKNKFLSGYLNE